MRRVEYYTGALLAAALLTAGCETNPAPVAPAAQAPAPKASAVRIEASAGAPKEAQSAMIYAKPGDVIEFGPGRFEFRSTLSLDVSSVTVRGTVSNSSVGASGCVCVIALP